MSKGSKVVFVAYVHNIDTFNAMLKGSKEALTVLIVTHVIHVERVERLHYVYNIHLILCQKGRKIMLYVETRDKHIFAHNFLNIQPILNPQKVLES